MYQLLQGLHGLSLTLTLPRHIGLARCARARHSLHWALHPSTLHLALHCHSRSDRSVVPLALLLLLLLYLLLLLHAHALLLLVLLLLLLLLDSSLLTRYHASLLHALLRHSRTHSAASNVTLGHRQRLVLSLLLHLRKQSMGEGDLRVRLCWDCVGIVLRLCWMGGKLYP